MVTNRPAQRFQDILDGIHHIQSFVHGMTQDEFEADIVKRFAVERAFLIISEAATKLGEIAEEVEPTIPWKDIRGLGNILRHNYDGVDMTDVWNYVQNDLKPLRQACERALAQPGLRARSREGK